LIIGSTLKSRKRWIWIALSRRTRQVVAYVVGDRSAATCRKLWQRIPALYRAAHCYTDFWEAYRQVIPTDQHTPCGKDSGLTAHVERWNNTLKKSEHDLAQ
jgi:IS1 family transposase